MPNALIFSPGLDGHRQVYVFVITHVLEQLGYQVFIAGNLQQKVSNSFYIDKLKINPNITIFDTSLYNGGGIDINISDLIKLQISCKADLTVLTEADNHIPLLISQIYSKEKRLKGRIVGIFMRPFYFYKPNTLLDKLRFIKHFVSRWNKDQKLFFDFFLKRFRLIDVPLSIDENYVHKNMNFSWIPDVFQKYADSIVPAQEKSEQRVWMSKLDTFLADNKSRFSYLYFGTAQYRRGYDKLLKLADETGGCFIHCGLKDSKVEYLNNTEEIISKLRAEKRYFETNEFIEDSLCIEYFFKSVSHLILPYIDFLGSSGIMLQALDFGVPVLTPDTAIIGYRVKKYNLGMTFPDSNLTSLKTQLDSFKNRDPSIFKEDIKTYMKLQSTEQLKNALINSFTGSTKLVILP